MCSQLAVGTAASLDDPEAGSQAYADSAWTGNGAVSLWERKGGLGLRLARLDANAALQGSIQTIWSDQPGTQQPHIDVSSDVVAVASLGYEGTPNPRTTCHLGFVRVSGTSIKTPFRVSDAPNGSTMLNEVSACGVTAADGSFIVVWTQMVDDKSVGWSLLAQRFDLQGNVQGSRLTLAAGGSKGLSQGGSLAFDGKRVLVAHLDQSDQPMLTAISGDQLTSTPLSAVAPPQVRPEILWVGKLLLRWSDQAAEIDTAGKLLAGPVKMPLDARIARVGGELVMVYRNEFVLAQRLDAKLAAQGVSVSLSQDRTASLQHVVSAADGSTAVAFYFDQGFRAAALRCGSTVPPPAGPQPCPEKSSVSPLGDGCTSDVCYAVIRLDYKTLGLKGYAIVGGPYQPTDAAAAMLAAEAAFKQYGQYLPAPLNVSLSPAQAGLYLASVQPGDFGGYCLVGVDSGVVVAAGGIVWAGHGQWWSPASWTPVDALSCGPTPVTAQAAWGAAVSCPSGTVPGSSYGAKDAITVALRTNLAAYYASRGPFSAYAMLYTPSVGACDPGVAELVVVFSQRRK